MSRIRAAALALVVTLAIFALAVAAAMWLFGSATFMDALSARWFPAAIVAFNALVTCLLVVVLVVRRRRAEKEAEEERPDLYSASERLRREVQRGRAGR
jgi:membrane protein implicated in regulation of membrane protease activity